MGLLRKLYLRRLFTLLEYALVREGNIVAHTLIVQHLATGEHFFPSSPVLRLSRRERARILTAAFVSEYVENST